MELLELKDLTIHYFTDEGVVRAVSYTHLDVYKRQAYVLSAFGHIDGKVFIIWE